MFRKKMGRGRHKFENINRAQELIHGPNEADQSDELVPPQHDRVEKSSNLSDAEVYKIMREMQDDITASCESQKNFNPDGTRREKLEPQAEIIQDRRCFVSALSYHSHRMPYTGWKGLNDLDVIVYFFSVQNMPLTKTVFQHSAINEYVFGDLFDLLTNGSVKRHIRICLKAKLFLYSFIPLFFGRFCVTVLHG